MFGSWSVMLFKCANAQAHSAKSVPPGRALDLSLLSVGCPNINLFVDFPNLSLCAVDLMLICLFCFDLPHSFVPNSYG
jgi:hypothetical protein